jgi:hypothetical protein
MFRVPRNRVVSRDRLLERVWGYEPSIETRSVDVHIGRLRRKLRSAGHQIETVVGLGYRFVDAARVARERPLRPASRWMRDSRGPAVESAARSTLMPQPTQTFKNHARFLPPFHFFVIPVLFINFVDTVWQLYESPSGRAAWTIVVAAALLVLALLARTMPLRVQDRVIRLEMRLRLKDTLPLELQGRINELTCAQLVALRFASDDELPALVRETLAGTLPSQKSIKERVRNWQADFLRV